MEVTYGNDLAFSDVFIIPRYSEVTSRATVDTSSTLFDNLMISVPIISANMDTITESAMATAMLKAGGLGAIHRFMSIEDNVKEYLASPSQTLVSIGVNGTSRERFAALYVAGARNFIVDIAHGHSLLMKDMLWFIKSKANDIKVVAGNVATLEAVEDLVSWGADAIKIGIGPGAACLTKNVTGVTVPQFSAISNCASTLRKGRIVPLIADGGITEIGDIAKALVAGASLVMCGRLLASCAETPGPRVAGKKVYRGMASKDAMLKVKSEDNLPTAEGASLILDDEMTTADIVVKHIKGGLQSAFSYSNAENILQFQEKARIGVRR